MKRLKCILLALVSCVSLYAQYPTTGIPSTWQHVGDVDEKGFYYRLYVDKSTNENCADLYWYRGENRKLKSIPSKIKFEKQTYILRSIINLVTDNGIDEIVIPESVRMIGCLDSQRQLSSFKVKGEIKTIRDQAFSNFNNLQFVQIPPVDSIGSYAFSGCKRLRSVMFSSVKDIKGGVFSECENLRFISWLGKVNISTIPKYMFYKCTSLETFDFPSSVSNISIGECAFFECNNLRSFSTSAYCIENVGENAFYGCKQLTSVKSKIIEDMNMNTKFYISGSAGNRAFQNCESLKDVILYAIDSIGDYAFSHCISLEEASITSVKFLGDGAFDHCSSLKKVLIGDQLKYFDTFSFYDCNELVDFGGLRIDMEYRFNPSGLSNSLMMNKVQRVAHAYPVVTKIRIRDEIEKWSKKKEYETKEDWRNRVNETTRRNKVEELKDSARVWYIKSYAPKELECSILSYDADDGVYKIEAKNVNNYKGYYKSYLEDGHTEYFGPVVYVFAKVPVSEAPAFKENFDKVKIEPTYCIAKNYLGIASCKFTLNGKTYVSPVLYDDETANVQIDLPPLKIDLGGGKKNDMASSSNQEKIDDTLDKNIPSTNVSNNRTFVVIIGNEKYSQVANVPYAERDAKVFAEYCRKTLGVPDKNVRTYGNATYAGFVQAINDIKKIAEAYNGDLSVVFYYAGHGVPNEQSKDAYLLPVDADGKQMDVCYSVGKLYKELNGMNAKNVVVFMDACFSGSQRGDGMLASARGVALKAKAETPQGNMVVFSAATGDETAYPYKEKGHGLFTYFLLKKLQESKGDCTLGELGEYIQQNVRQQSVVINRKSQSPTVMPSQTMIESWKNMKLK